MAEPSDNNAAQAAAGAAHESVNAAQGRGTPAVQMRGVNKSFGAKQR